MVPPGFNQGDFFSFRYMNTPIIIRVICIVAVVPVTISALLALLQGSTGGILSGVLIFLFGNQFLRIYLELVMLFFGMHDAFRSIERQRR